MPNTAPDPPAPSQPPRRRFTDLNALPVAVSLGTYRADVLGWGFVEPRPWRNYLHAHSFFEICYAFTGRGTFSVNGTTHAVAVGDVFAARPGEPHEIVADRRRPLGIYFWSHTLVRGRAPAGGGAGGDVDAVLSGFERSTARVSPAVGFSMLRTLELLTDEVVHRRPGHAMAVAGLAGKLLLDTARAASVDGLKRSPPRHRRGPSGSGSCRRPSRTSATTSPDRSASATSPHR
ncbi:MAG TPA: AraC family ligand binding domain-containing protein [Tepidisphaeraceae bacterium]|nr:AraC family ligand binding domain-containing protein [Tepidisphaeraceae bacterium]